MIPEGFFSPLYILELLYRLIREPLSYEPAIDRVSLSIFTRGKEELLQPFVDEALSRSEEWRSAIGLQLHMLLDEAFLLPEGAHGVWSKNSGIALVIEEYPEIIYHEFLHLFGVGEGYDPLAKATSPFRRAIEGCEECWMQWEPSCGMGLCHEHQRELRKFLSERNARE